MTLLLLLLLFYTDAVILGLFLSEIIVAKKHCYFIFNAIPEIAQSFKTKRGKRKVYKKQCKIKKMF